MPDEIAKGFGDDFDPDAFDRMTPAERMEAFVRMLGLTAKALYVAAQMLAVMDKNGDDVSGIGGNLIGWLRLVGNKQLLPELIVKHQNYPSLMHKLKQMPMPVQQSIVDGEPVKLVVCDNGGGYTHRLMPVEALTTKQIRQVFNGVGINSEAAQIAIIEEGKLKPIKKAAAKRRDKFDFNEPDEELSPIGFKGGNLLRQKLRAMADDIRPNCPIGDAVRKALWMFLTERGY